MDNRIVLILVISIISYIFGEKLHCPRNVPYFSTNPCLPDSDTSRCPSGYRCRQSRDDNRTNNVYFICCAETEMSTGDYFIEADLSPRAIPQIPLSTLQRIVMFDRNSGQRLQIPGIDADVSGVDRIQNDTAYFGQLESVEFQFPLDVTAGQFLHFIVSQQPLTKPSSIHIYYDYPSFGTATVNLTEMGQRLRRGFVEFISNETVPIKEFYRNLIVVLAFRTENQLITTEMLPRNMDTQISQLIQNSSGDLSKFLSSQLISERLGVAIGGSFFHVTSRGTIFKVQEKQVISSAMYYNSQHTLIIVTVLINLLNVLKS